MRKTFTISERHALYKKAYERIGTRKNTLICIALNDEINEGFNKKSECSGLYIPSSRMSQVFPEFALFHDPGQAGITAWWNVDATGYKERLIALGLMIAMTESES